MKTSHVLLFAFGLGLASAVAQTPSPPPAQPSGSQKSALDLYRKLSASTSKPSSMQNLVLCPGGAQRLLTALHLGAKGETAEQLAKFLQLDPKSPPPALNAAGPSPVLKIASAIWVDPAQPLLPDYQKASPAHVASVPLQSDPEAARKTINDWAAENTGGNIKDLLQSSDMSDARLVLTDAAWFKDSWKQAFQPERTLTAAFTLPSGKAQPSRFLHDQRKALYAKTTLGEALAIPFATARYQCLCLLPTQQPKETAAAALLRLEAKLNPSSLSAFTAALSETTVDLRLPKLDLRGLTANLIPALRDLGVTAAFGNVADFSALAKGGENLKVGVFKQSAAFKLDEQGAEAAAATAAVVVTKSAAQRPTYQAFHANRPCLFLIRDTVTDDVVFLVRCAAPAAAD